AWDQGEVLRKLDTTTSQVTTLPATGLVLGVSWSPDGAQIVYASRNSAGTVHELRLINADGTGDHLLLGGPASKGQPAWSPGSSVTTVASGDFENPDWQPILRGYPRPKGGTPAFFSLVVAFEPCGSPNRTHATPLSQGSCNPPQQASDYLTVGTPDANGAVAN